MSPTTQAHESAGNEKPELTIEKVTEVEGISEYRLSNGLRLLLFPDASKDVVTVNMTVFVGSRHEGYGEAGMAHLLEHMVFKGTPTRDDISKSLADRGARFNGTTWLDRTNYYETLPANDDNLKFALQLESDRLVNSLIREEDLESEMTVVRNEFEAGEDSPIRILMQRVQSCAYDWHGYGRPTIGNRSDIERVPVVKLRRFYKKFYRPDNVMVIIAGKFDTSKALEYMGETFGTLTVPKTPIDDTYTIEPAQDGERSVTLRRVGDVQYVASAYHIPAGSHPDYAAAQVLVNILSDRPSGRLYKELVETELASQVFALAYGLAEPGLLMALAEVPMEKSTDDAMERLLDVIENSFAENPITEKEVQRAVQKLLKQQELEAAETDQIAVSLSDWAAQGDWRLYFLYRDTLENLSVDQVQRAAERYLVRNNRTTGTFIPCEQAQRIQIPTAPDINQRVGNYTGREAACPGEAFDPDPLQIEQRTLRGELIPGIHYALVPKKTRGQSVQMGLYLNFGTAENLRGRVAAAELLGLLMARGTDKLDYAELQDELTRMRANLSVSSSVGRLQLSVKTKREFLSGVIELIRDVLNQPRLDAAELEVVRRQIVASLQQGASDPQRRAMLSIQRSMSPYPKDSVLYVPTIEEEIESYEAVTCDEIRQLHEQFIGKESGQFVAIGAFDPDTLLPRIKQALDGLESKEPYAYIPRPAQTGVSGNLDIIQLDDKANAFFIATQQYHLSDQAPDYAPLVIGNYILGASALSSRLGDRVRKQEGLSYGVGSALSARPKDDRVDLMVYAITNPGKKDKLIATIHEEIEKVVSEGVTEGEVADAKKAYLEAARIRRTTDGPLTSQMLGQVFLKRTMESTADLERRIDALTADDVNAAVRKYLNAADLVSSIAGDFAKNAPEPTENE
ncbi:MAG: pitrilysin family protein [Planctomycetota bacterium]